MHAQVPFFPPTQSLADFPEHICQRLLKSAIRVPDLDVEVLSVRKWTMYAEVAEHFKVSSPHFFCTDQHSNHLKPKS